MGSLLQRSLPPSTLVVAIDPGKAPHRVWLSTDAAGLVTEPLTVPVLRAGLETLDGLVRRYSAGGQLVFAVEAAGSLHRAWVSDLSRRFPAPVRVFAPSETAAARTQLGMRRFKTDDRDCAALTYLTRQGHGRPVPADEHEALLAAVRWRRSLITNTFLGQRYRPGPAARQAQGPGPVARSILVIVCYLLS
jgi:hypothetical protein